MLSETKGDTTINKSMPKVLLKVNLETVLTHPEHVLLSSQN